MNAATKQRKALNKNKIKEPKIPKEKDKTLILCPLKEVNIYQYIYVLKNVIIIQNKNALYKKFKKGEKL